MAAARKKKVVRAFLDDEKKSNILKYSGIAVMVFALFSFISVVSYLFTWSFDQSLLSHPEMMDRGVEVANWAGKVGAVRVKHETYNGEQQAKVAFCLSKRNQDKLSPAKFNDAAPAAAPVIEDSELPFM